jgi:hypothetical protein
MTTEPAISAAHLVTSISRPKRVAFLVDPSNVLQHVLDSIIRVACQSWAGAYYVVIPVRDGEVISDDWGRLLRLADPDMIVTLTRVSDAAIGRIERDTCPAELVEISVDQAARNERYIVSPHDVRALGIEGIVPMMANDRRGVLPPRFLYLYGDPQPGANKALFISRNFGTLDKIVSNDRAFENVNNIAQHVPDVAPSNFLNQFIDRPPAPVVPRDIAAAFGGRRWIPEYDQATEAFQLYVGDDPMDAIAAWNRMSTSESWMNRSGLWLPCELAQDADFLAVLGRWIQRNYWPGGQTQGRILVLSYSLSEEQLQPVVLAMREAAHIPSVSRTLTAEQFLIPVERNRSEVDPFRATAYTGVTGGLGHAPLSRPPFAEGPAQEHREWMVDFELEFKQQASGDDRIQLWRLPKRLAVARLFASGHRARIVSSGRPSFQVTGADLTVPFKIPSPYSVFYATAQGDMLRSRDYPPYAFDFATSSAGSSLSGLISLFGTLHSAADSFEDPYWRQILLDLAERPADRFDREVAKVEGLLELAQNDLGDAWIADEVKRREGAERIAKGVFQSEGDRRRITLEQLRTKFNRSPHKRDGERFDEFPRRVLEYLVESAVLLYGAEVRCSVCRTAEWHSIDAISREMRCNGCLNIFPLPLEIEWSYRLNDLVGNAVRRHGVVTLLQLLSELTVGAVAMYAWLPSQDVFDPKTGNRITDLDLVALRDGRLHIGEAKSHPRGLKQTDLDALATIAMQLRPDVVHIAATGTEWPPEVVERIARFRSQLDQERIAVREHLFPPSGRV